MSIRARIVDLLERACTWKDTRPPGPLAGWRGCWLAGLSGRLDERWRTGRWEEPGL